MIERPLYWNKIKPFVGKGIIKVFTGIRRCGKSCLLQLIANELIKNGNKEKTVISANFESLTDDSVTSVAAMMERVARVVKENPGQQLSLFFDEIQELDGWEKMLNALLIDYPVDIYITGSNAHLLSGELATYLGGRYVEFPVFPLSFAEAMPVLSSEGFSGNQALLQYVVRGGFPFLYDAGVQGFAAKGYLSDVYSSVVLKDIAKRHNVRDIGLLEKFLSFLVSEVSHPFSITKTANFLKGQRRTVGTDTIYNFLSYAEEACLVRLLRRNDLVGKELMTTQEKIFLMDHGFREALFGTNERQIDRVLENIVAIELIRRGWSVSVGKMHHAEVDFVAERGGERRYYQVAYLMPTDETRTREFASLKAIRDNHPKLVLSMDEVDFSTDGILHRKMCDWLLDAAD